MRTVTPEFRKQNFRRIAALLKLLHHFITSLFASQEISICSRIDRPCTTPCAVHCLPVTVRVRTCSYLLLVCLARKTKVPGRKTNEGTAQLLLRRIARMWPQGQKLTNDGI